MKRSLKSTLASLAFAGLMGGVARAADNPRVTMIIYTSPGVNFFDPLLKGANDAAKQLNVDLDIQYANNDQATENNIIQTAIANKVDGIAAIIRYSEREAFTLFPPTMSSDGQWHEQHHGTVKPERTPEERFAGIAEARKVKLG